MEALGLTVTPELSNYLTQLEQIAHRDYDRKCSNEAKALRTTGLRGRMEQKAARYKKDWITDPSLKPGAGFGQAPPTIGTDDEDDDDEEEDGGGDDDAQSLVQGLRGGEVVFEMEMVLGYDENKKGRELDVHEPGTRNNSSSSSRSSSSSSTRPTRKKGGWSKHDGWDKI